MVHNQGKGFSWHGILMAICCIIPMALVLFFLAGGNIAGFSSNSRWLILLLCPLMHIAMMFAIRGEGSCHGGHGKKTQETGE